VAVDEGRDPVAAAVAAARLRLRPILMTSIAFILGVVPLALASGAGAAARVSMGVTVSIGMLIATLFGILIVPVLFVAVERLSAWLRGLVQRREPAAAERREPEMHDEQPPPQAPAPEVPEP
jgi:predicted RND superfamily exporter protein